MGILSTVKNLFKKTDLDYQYDNSEYGKQKRLEIETGKCRERWVGELQQKTNDDIDPIASESQIEPFKVYASGSVLISQKLYPLVTTSGSPGSRYVTAVTPPSISYTEKQQPYNKKCLYCGTKLFEKDRSCPACGGPNG